jgi:uncharacterized membrane protein YgcG
MPGNEPEVSTTKIAPAPAKDSVTPPTTPRKRTRRLSFADEYDGGKLENTVFAENLHYSQERPQQQKSGGRNGGGGGGGGGGSGGGGCCVIS